MVVKKEKTEIEKINSELSKKYYELHSTLKHPIFFYQDNAGKDNFCSDILTPFDSVSEIIDKDRAIMYNTTPNSIIEANISHYRSTKFDSLDREFQAIMNSNVEYIFRNGFKSLIPESIRLTTESLANYNCTTNIQRNGISSYFINGFLSNELRRIFNDIEAYDRKEYNKRNNIKLSMPHTNCVISESGVNKEDAMCALIYNSICLIKENYCSSIAFGASNYINNFMAQVSTENLNAIAMHITETDDSVSIDDIKSFGDKEMAFYINGCLYEQMYRDLEKICKVCEFQLQHIYFEALRYMNSENAAEIPEKLTDACAKRYNSYDDIL